MELLYIWIYNYKCIKNQEFNFSSEIQFHFDVETLTLSKTSSENFTGKSFFSRNSEALNIENVSVITGQNGSGKSTISAFLFEFLAQKEPKESLIITKEEGNFVLYNYHVPIKLFDDERKRMGYEHEFKQFYKNEGDHFIRYNFEPLSYLFIEAYRGSSPDEYRQKLKLYNLEIKQAPYGPYFDDLKLNYIYYSPHYSSVYHFPYPMWNHDISTTCLIDTDFDSYENNKPGFKSEHIDKINSHIFQDYYRLASFISTLSSDFEDRLQINSPLGFNLSIDYERMKRIEEEARDNKNYKSIEKINELLPDETIFGSGRMKKYMFINGMVKAYLFTFIRNFLKDNSPLLDKAMEQILNLKDPLKNKPIELYKELYAFLGDISFDRMRSFDGLLEEINNLPESYFLQESKYVYVRFSELNINENQDRFNKVINYYSSSIIVDYFLNLYMYPKISAGEYSFFIVFSRLYYLLMKEDHKDNLIFFDEIEVTLHPELQRTTIETIILFLGYYFPERKFQLIFASHSPILLSDVPKGNALFLRKDDNGLTHSLPCNTETLGANIHTLYRNSFFLKDGILGTFAESVINDLINKVNNHEVLDEKEIYIVSQIGEPILRRSIEQMISPNSEHRIQELENENRELRKRLGEL